MVELVQSALKPRRERLEPAYLPISVDSLRIDKVLSFDIYVYSGRE